MAKITALSFIVPVRDIEKAVTFYCEAFDLQEVFRSEQIVFVGLPGTDSALGILLDPERAGSGPQHIGFHVDHAVEHKAAIKDVEAAGGSVIERGEHGPGIPFARIADPDGNVLEI
jgi:catechol 2,3-dioxygenase-like lactoylglutathione lyase family enzyme